MDLHFIALTSARLKSTMSINNAKMHDDSVFPALSWDRIPMFSLCEQYALIQRDEIPFFYGHKPFFKRATAAGRMRVIRGNAFHSLCGWGLSVFQFPGQIEVQCASLELGVDHAGSNTISSQTVAWKPGYLANSECTILLGDNAHPNLRVLFFCEDRPPELRFLSSTMMDLIPYARAMNDLKLENRPAEDSSSQAAWVGTD